MHVPVLPHPFMFLSGQVTHKRTEVKLHFYVHALHAYCGTCTLHNTEM